MEEEHRIANEQKDLVRHTHTHTQPMLRWSVVALSAALWSTLDDPEDSIPEAPAERGRGGVQQEGGTVPPLTEGAGWGEGDQRPAAEAAAGTTSADKVQTHAKNTLFHYSYNNNLKLMCVFLMNRRKETLTIRQTLDNLRLDLSVDEEDEDQTQQPEETITKVWGPPWKLTGRHGTFLSDCQYCFTPAGGHFYSPIRRKHSSAGLLPRKRRKRFLVSVWV